MNDLMNVDDRFEATLGAADPFNALRDLARRFADQGNDPSRILELFEAQRSRMRETNRETDEDQLMDVMDCLVGWCIPDMKLFKMATEPARK